MKKAGAKAPADFTNIPNYFFDGFLNWYKRWYKPRKIYENLREFGLKNKKNNTKNKTRNPLYYKGFRVFFLGGDSWNRTNDLLHVKHFSPLVV